jgi:serum/glucocorticoid-regulated kinase 3
MANHKFENKIYAIKVLSKEAIIKRNEVKHIMAERNVLIRNLKHPFLVGLHYSFQSNDKLYFVLDYVNGGEVKKIQYFLKINILNYCFKIFF